MAQRGKPIPFSVRQQIKEQRPIATVRRLAADLKLSKTTIQKYGKQNGTK